MGAGPSSRSGQSKQSGYALLMAIFLVSTIIILAAAVTPSILTQGRREREQEAIWRGNQYVRAIELYYRKNGRYPQTIDDVTRGNLGIHFLRKAYTDPTNSQDGSWRFIYVSPSGQLIGSVRYHSLQEMALMLKMPGAGQAPLGATGSTGQAGTTQQPGQQPGQQEASPSGASQAGTSQQQGASQQGNGQQATAQQNPGSPDQQAQTPPAPSQQGFAAAQGAFASSFGAQPTSAVPLEPVDGPVLGAFVIGVASKIKRPSLIVYQGGKTYFEWEFIYNPLSVVGANGAAPGAPGGAIPPPVTPPGTNGPAGTAPGFSPTPGGSTPIGLPPMTSTP